jgi:quercetin dioxygenase-like cupin family protein
LSGVTDAQTIVVKPDQLSWMDNPTIQGGQMAILTGDPTKAETVVMRFKFPANRRQPPHSHPHAEIVTVLSGSVGYGEGGKFDTSKGEIGKAGTFAVVPANQAHFVWTGDEEAVVQVQFVGPFGINYINPADDPRKK